jgi:hypothetical protein
MCPQATKLAADKEIASGERAKGSLGGARSHPGSYSARNRGRRRSALAGLLGATVAIVLVVVGPFVWTEIELHGYPAAFYDLQGFLATDNSTYALIYNVTANEQTSDCPYGVAYLLNGVTSDGGWYQDGLAWNWRDGGEGRFTLIYDVFNPSGAVIDPVGGGAGFAEFGGAIHPGDTVRLVLAVGDGTVQMNAFDESTKSVAVHYPPATISPSWIGAYVLGTPTGSIFTGLMTECYRGSYGNTTLQDATFTDLGAPITNAQLCVDERDFSNGSYPTGLGAKVPLNCGGDLSYYGIQEHSFTSNGLELTANATSFSTRSI